MKHKLKKEVQVFIVQSLARYMDPTEIVEAVKVEFDVEINRQLVRHYNPKQTESSKEKWGELYDETRANFLKAQDEIGIAQQTYRLNCLHTMLNDAMSINNHVIASQLLEQAAKEVGGQYTNRHRQDLHVNGNLTGTLDPDRLEAARNGVIEIQRRLSDGYNRPVDWNEAIDEILKYNRDATSRAYLGRLKDEGPLALPPIQVGQVLNQ